MNAASWPAWFLLVMICVGGCSRAGDRGRDQSRRLSVLSRGSAGAKLLRRPFKREVAEISLAHGNRDRVEAAYARAEFRDQRRQLSDAWGAFCSMPSSRPAGDVVDFRRGA